MPQGRAAEACSGGPARARQGQAHPEGQGVGPGLSPLDYVKNKIVEEMTKGEGSSSSTTSSSSLPTGGSSQHVAGAKRPLQCQEDINSKKPCINTQVSSNITQR